jgi:hypothetical protein
MFIKTNDILTALKAAMLALQLPASYAAVADYPKAFTTVAVYRNENLLKALEDLFTYDDRVCLLVPGGDNYDNVTQGTNVYSARASDIVLLIADRDYSKEQAELIGGTDAPGVIALKDLVVVALTGSNLNISGVTLLPTSGDPLRLTDKEREEAPGRDCWAQTFNTTAGRVKAPIIRQPT